MSYHELTEKLYKDVFNAGDWAYPMQPWDHKIKEFDSIVREYIERIAGELDINCAYYHKKKTSDILGISEPKESYPCECKKPRSDLKIDRNGFCQDCKMVIGNWGPKEPIVEKKWCEHLEERSFGMAKEWWVKSFPVGNPSDGVVTASWHLFGGQFCPICGTKRPEELSEEEELAKTLFSKHASVSVLCPWNEADDNQKPYWKHVADTALTWMKSKESK